jgi:hypothetical protein
VEHDMVAPDVDLASIRVLVQSISYVDT